jgi:hypothetical protein
MVARRSTEVTGLMGSESSVPSLFSGQTGASTVVGTNMGNNLSRLGPRIDEQMASNDPLRMVIRFPVIRTGQVAVWVFLRVEYHHYRPEIAATMPPYSSAGVGIRSSGADWFKSAAQTGTGIIQECLW